MRTFLDRWRASLEDRNCDTYFVTSPKIWFFYGALSDVEYDLRVTDTETGAVRTYHNAPGNLCGHGDTSAFGD